MVFIYQVQFNEQEAVSIESDCKGSLLDDLEKSGIEASYHCRNGFCGACRCTLVSGTVNYFAEPLAYVRKGDILPCICRAKGDLTLLQN